MESIYKVLTGHDYGTLADNEELNVTPSTQDQTFDESDLEIPKTGYLPVTVKGDENLTAENIKSGVTIFDVEGSYDPVDNESLEVMPGTAAQTFDEEDLDEGKSGFCPVFVYGDANLIASNVRRGKRVFGVDGLCDGVYATIVNLPDNEHFDDYFTNVGNPATGRMQAFSIDGTKAVWGSSISGFKIVSGSFYCMNSGTWTAGTSTDVFTKAAHGWAAFVPSTDIEIELVP